MRPKKYETLNCPVCGAEYLASEIFVPNGFFGKPILVQRNNDNKITEFYGTPMDTTEHYCCDFCGSEFSIFAKVQIYTQHDIFSEEGDN